MCQYNEGVSELSNNNILEELNTLIEESAHKRQSFLVAITKSSRAISEGANQWFSSECKILEKELAILKNVMPEDALEWNQQIRNISNRFSKALTYLNGIVAQAEKGEIKSIGTVPMPKPSIDANEPLGGFVPPRILEKKEEEKELNLVSAILEVFDSATALENLIKEIEKESKRTLSTARLILKVIQASKKG
jgi:hypothetical protein